MLRNVRDLQGYAIGATDGTIGDIDDFYFDDQAWAIRYLIVDTGTWLSGRKVLISPIALGHPDWAGRRLPVSLTKAQVEKSPDIDTRKPVSRQTEALYSGYYTYPYYWDDGGLWGIGAHPGGMTIEDRRDAETKKRSEGSGISTDDSHLRSCRAVEGSHIHAIDGDIGHIEDFLVDDYTWAVRYLVVKTSNWWGGHQVLVAPQWTDAVNWPMKTVSIGMTREAIKEAPPYNPAVQLDRQQEEAMHDYYRRPGYWTTTHEPEHLVHSAK